MVLPKRVAAALRLEAAVPTTEQGLDHPVMAVELGLEAAQDSAGKVLKWLVHPIRVALQCGLGRDRNQYLPGLHLLPEEHLLPSRLPYFKRLPRIGMLPCQKLMDRKLEHWCRHTEELDTQLLHRNHPEN